MPSKIIIYKNGIQKPMKPIYYADNDVAIFIELVYKNYKPVTPKINPT